MVKIRNVLLGPSLGAVLALSGSSCEGDRSAAGRLVTDDWRAAVSDTIRSLIAESARAYESMNCDEHRDLAWLPEQPPFVHFTAEDQIITLATREDVVAYCQRMNQGRSSASEEVESQTVHVLAQDAAYVVTRSVQRTVWQDGRSSEVPTVETAIASRQNGRWRIIYKHISWRDAPG